MLARYGIVINVITVSHVIQKLNQAIVYVVTCVTTGFMITVQELKNPLLDWQTMEL